MKVLWNLLMKVVSGVKLFFSATAEGLEMERYFSGAQNQADLEQRMRNWERRQAHQNRYY